MNGAAVGAYWRLYVVRERNNQVKVVVIALKYTDDDNVWEVEQLRDSLEMHRI
jgi:hypothetical protein